MKKLNKAIIFMIVLVLLPSVIAQSGNILIEEISYPENKIHIAVVINFDVIQKDNVFVKGLFYEDITGTLFKTERIDDLERNNFTFEFEKNLALPTIDEWESTYSVEVQVVDSSTEEILDYLVIPVEVFDPEYYLCNKNGICDACTAEGCPYFETGETHETCPEDCPPEEELIIIDESRLEEFEGSEERYEEEKPSVVKKRSYLFLIIVFVLFIGLFSVIWFYYNKIKNERAQIPKFENYK